MAARFDPVISRLWVRRSDTKIAYGHVSQTQELSSYFSPAKVYTYLS